MKQFFKKILQGHIRFCPQRKTLKRKKSLRPEISNHSQQVNLFL